MSTQANKDIQHIGRKSMIHEDRVRQMIKLAVYDENKSMGEKKPAQYFRKDYLALEMIKSFFCGTMAYAIIVILGAVYLLGNGAGDISTVNFIRILILTVVLYAVFLGICRAFTNLTFNGFFALVVAGIAGVNYSGHGRHLHLYIIERQYVHQNIVSYNVYTIT